MTNPLWHHHPHVRAGGDLRFGERAADRMRAAMGSWRFVGWSLAFLAAWIYAARSLHLRIDNPQLTILNLILSCFAALQGAIILLAANRADAVTAELAAGHYRETSQMDELIKRNTELTEQIHDLTRQVAALIQENPHGP